MSGSEWKSLKQRIERLTTERSVLFTRVQQDSPRAADDRSRLKVIEREMDECFAALRRLQAARDVDRFSQYGVPRRPFPRTPRVD